LTICLWTARELQVLELIIACNNNKRIASLLNIDHKTVHSHRIHIMKKLGMNSSRFMPVPGYREVTISEPGKRALRQHFGLAL
jgi:DNA-binding NarL/FixJ family response regulator